MKVNSANATRHFETFDSAVYPLEVDEIASAGKPRTLGAGKALSHLPSQEELEQIDGEWKRAIEEKPVGARPE